MPNAIKYNVSAETLALKKGNFYIGTGDVGKGPTNVTGYYNGITPPAGGFTIYLNKESNGPSIYVASNDAQLISLTNSIAGASYTTVNECLVYFAGQTDKICVNRDYEGIVTDGLVFNVDAGFTPSYPRTGTTIYDISGGNNVTLTNGPTFNSDNGGSIVFDWVDDRINFVDVLNFGSTDTFSVSVWFNNSQPLTSPENIYGLVNKYYVNNFNGWTICLRGYSSGIMVRLSTSEGGGQFDDVGLIGVTKEEMSDGNWHNITITYDSNDLCSVYVDGGLKGTRTYSGYDFTNDKPLSIGSFNNGNIYLNQDKISTTKIYNRALTSSEITQNFNAQKGRFGL